MADEFDIIEHLRKAVAPHDGVEVGIGDDAAVLEPTIDADRRSLVTVDLLAEGTHFTIPPATPRQIGRKALAVNLSDIAAMAGEPTAAFVAVALPRARGEAFAEELLAGIHELAEEFHVSIAGGDTNIWDGPLVISVTVIGRPTGLGPVLRSGAREGDWLMVTGPLGGSLAGRHLSFTPRIAPAQALHAAVELHAMIDLSDGLSRDVRHITCEQGYVAVIEAAAVPIHGDVPSDLPHDERIRRALNDGEDFELLLAVSPKNGQRLLSSPPAGCSLFKVGTVTDSADRVELLWPDCRREPLEPHGYEHRF